MPVYNYVCNQCGARFDHWLSFKDADVPVGCPNGHTNIRKVLIAPSVVYKGSGFYVTDHRSKTSPRTG